MTQKIVASSCPLSVWRRHYQKRVEIFLTLVLIIVLSAAVNVPNATMAAVFLCLLVVAIFYLLQSVVCLYCLMSSDYTERFFVLSGACKK